LKSNVSDYLELVEAIYIDACAKCSADVSDLRDLKTVRSRTEDEGISFLTITLPSFSKDFEKSLEQGYISPTSFRSFRKLGAIPAFLQGMLGKVFSSETGELIHEPPTKVGDTVSDLPTIIESVRQICCTFKKVEMDCTPERVQAALDSFIEIEHGFKSFSIPYDETSEFLELCHSLWDNMVSDFSDAKIIPRHGPGATAERISGNQKYTWKLWHDRLEPYFPLIDNGYPLGISTQLEDLKSVTIVSEEHEQPVRVIPVPKTLKAPRIIAIEPCCQQFVQQGIRAYLYDKLETYWLTKGHVNLTDQSVNQRLAVTSSIDGLYATIDLSDASDRVPRSLAMAMFRGNFDLEDSIDACRSTRAQLPDGHLLDGLEKFASMGSALCFPVEAMYFYTICVKALLDAQKLSYVPTNIFMVSRGIFVYGDDIIVPREYADIVLEYLQRYNCKVNTNKTFLNGKFRESCGVDAYDGMVVTPIYLRQERPENKRQSRRIISWTKTANLFYLKGYWRSSKFLYDYVERIIGEELPYIKETSEGIGRISFLGFETVERWNSDLHRLEVRALVPRPVRRTDVLDGFGALMKFFLNGEWRDNPEGFQPSGLSSFIHQSEGADLKATSLHGAVTLKHRWILPH